MTTYRYALDRSSKKYQCPQCSKRTFVRYIESETKRCLEGHLGRCDRESKCGYHCTPKGNKPLVDSLNTFHIKEDPSYHRGSVIGDYGNNYMKNNFILFLRKKFNRNDILKAIDLYMIGTSNHWDGATVFWQTDRDMNVKAGKVMLYDPVTGKRVKEPYPHINWMHKVMNKRMADGSNSLNYDGKTNLTVKDELFILEQCLFGLHNVTNDLYKTIAIVESEKTAIMMSLYLPCYIWMATGSQSGFKEELLKPLKGRNILSFPDKSCFNDWNAKASLLNTKGFNIACSKFAELECFNAGDDLIDYF